MKPAPKARRTKKARTAPLSRKLIVTMVADLAKRCHGQVVAVDAMTEVINCSHNNRAISAIPTLKVLHLALEVHLQRLWDIKRLAELISERSPPPNTN